MGNIQEVFEKRIAIIGRDIHISSKNRMMEWVKVLAKIQRIYAPKFEIGGIENVSNERLVEIIELPNGVVHIPDGVAITEVQHEMVKELTKVIQEEYGSSLEQMAKALESLAIASRETKPSIEELSLSLIKQEPLKEEYITRMDLDYFKNNPTINPHFKKRKNYKRKLNKNKR